MTGRRVAVVAILAAVGCQSGAKPDLREPTRVEEFVAPPDEARFNQPPEMGYRKPPPKKEFKPGMGGMGGGPAGMGGMGGPTQ
jgi:hypothetical protein